MKGIEKIGVNCAKNIQSWIASGKEDLAIRGLAVGAVVQTKLGVYRITQVRDNPSVMFGFWFMGQKLRRDGTYGEHWHNVGHGDDIIRLVARPLPTPPTSETPTGEK